MAVKHRPSLWETPWDTNPNKSAVQQFLIDKYQERYIDRHPVLSATGEEDVINSFPPSTCPYCNADSIVKRGFTKNGVQRYKCHACEKTFTPITGTIFDSHKVSISEWIEFVLNLTRYVSINAGSWNNRNEFETSRYWLEKVFLLLENYQDNIMLSGRVWLDETYYSVRSNDIARSASGKKLRGLSQNQLCIGVACDKQQIVCLLEGTGRPSKKKTYNAFKDHIAKGSILIHDKDTAHSMLVSNLNLRSEAHDANAIKKLPDNKNPLNRVNQVHARIKDFLYAHRSFNRGSIQGYLNLFAFISNPPGGHLEKADELLNLAFNVRKTLRYRDFYG